MGSDLYHLQRDIEQRTHGTLRQVLQRVRGALEGRPEFASLLVEIDQALRDSAIQ